MQPTNKKIQKDSQKLFSLFDKKLSPEKKQLVRLKLLAPDALREIKAFGDSVKEKKNTICKEN